jgi:hypothetical protein
LGVIPAGTTGDLVHIPQALYIFSWAASHVGSLWSLADQWPLKAQNDRWMFPFHTLEFAVRRIMVDYVLSTLTVRRRKVHLPHCIGSKGGYRCPNGYDCVSEPTLQKLHGSEVSRDDSIGRTVTNVQLVCHFIESHPSVFENQRAGLFNVPISR